MFKIKKLAKKRLLAIFMHKPNQLCLKLGIALVVYALLSDVIYFKKKTCVEGCPWLNKNS